MINKSIQLTVILFLICTAIFFKCWSLLASLFIAISIYIVFKYQK